ncbi:methyltransferase domain-containing protein [Kribbella pratensis]|uniref:Methyltransferase family protein n=1 Tax=Kribbella pratensis TaxID=2512112 RepID=A0A4V3GI00_9ACTN|nr:methyltransferase domain-containing protein [Kribbella pratensis]TDW78037.1 methyltransferase family protein [Kribbella pratensis]
MADQNIDRQAFVLDQMAGRPAVRTLKAWALDQLAPTAGETAVDVGSGTGEDVVALHELGARAVGVEPSPGLRAEAVRRAAGADVEYVDGHAEALPFEDESVDVLRSERVLQHVDDPAAVVEEMARVLRPGGRIVLIDTDWGTAIIHPADPDVLQRMVGYFLRESANPYSGRQLRGLLAEAGLEITGETAATWLEPQEGARQGFVGMMHLTSLQAGVITAEEAEAFAQTLGEAADRGAFHMSLTMYAVSAIKPRAV